MTLIIKKGLHQDDALAVKLELIKTLTGNPTPPGMNLLSKSIKFQLSYIKLRIESL